MGLKLSKVYVPIDVKIELPKNGEWVTTTDNRHLLFSENYGFTYDGSLIVPNEKYPTHWLKEQTLYTFTKEKLERLIGDAWEASKENITEFQEYPYGRRGGYQKPDKQDYINSILK